MKKRWDVKQRTDECPFDAEKTLLGLCGCGVSDADSDGDGTADCDELALEEIIGTSSNGIMYWDVAASGWTQMTSSPPDGDIAVGDFTGDGIADVASIWPSGLWYQDGATLTWTKISGAAPVSVTAGDVTGDGLCEIIGTWNSGIWYRDVGESEWTKMASSTTEGDIAAGDFTDQEKLVMKLSGVAVHRDDRSGPLAGHELCPVHALHHPPPGPSPNSSTPCRAVHQPDQGLVAGFGHCHHRPDQVGPGNHHQYLCNI